MNRSFCCSNGKVDLQPFQPLPEIIEALLLKPDFISNIRAYNQMFSFTSLGVNLDDRFSHGIHNFRIQGQLFHAIGSLDRSTPKFAQLYIIDHQQALATRKSIFKELNNNYIHMLQVMMEQCNPFVSAFQRVKEILDGEF
jgi:hypothetical protein